MGAQLKDGGEIEMTKWKDFRLSGIETTNMTFNGQRITQFAKNVAWAGRKRNQKSVSSRYLSVRLC